MFDPIAFDNILRAVCKATRLSIYDIRSNSRPPKVVDARYTAFYLGHELRLGNGRELSKYLRQNSIMNPARVTQHVEDRLQVDREFKETYGDLIAAFMFPTIKEHDKPLRYVKMSEDVPLLSLAAVVKTVGKFQPVKIRLGNKEYEYLPHLQSFRQTPNAREKNNKSA